MVDPKPMLPEELAVVGRRLHGRRAWVSRLARQLDVECSTVWRWSNGRVAIPSAVAAGLRALNTQARTLRAIQKVVGRR